MFRTIEVYIAKVDSKIFLAAFLNFSANFTPSSWCDMIGSFPMKERQRNLDIILFFFCEFDFNGGLKLSVIQKVWNR